MGKKVTKQSNEQKALPAEHNNPPPPEPKTPIKAALIGGIFLIVGGLITLSGVIYNSRKTAQTTLDVVVINQEVKDKSEARKKKLDALEGAIVSIQQMKDRIADVTNNKNGTYSKAAEVLGKASQTLIDDYGGKCTDVCEPCHSECNFHKAKETGRNAYNFVLAQPKSGKISPATVNILTEYREDLTKYQREISAKKEIIEKEK